MSLLSGASLAEVTLRAGDCLWPRHIGNEDQNTGSRTTHVHHYSPTTPVQGLILFLAHDGPSVDVPKSVSTISLPFGVLLCFQGCIYVNSHPNLLLNL